MKNPLPLLFALLCLLCSCIKDETDNCPERVTFGFSYQYGGSNQFFEWVKTDVTLHFFQDGISYREEQVPIGRISADTPLRLDKREEGSVSVVGWSHDDAIDYVRGTGLDAGEQYVRLREITPGSGLCHPVDDLYFGSVTYDSQWMMDTRVTIPFVRAVCRVKITMIPQSMQDVPAGDVNATLTGYAFLLKGTVDRLNFLNESLGEKVTLTPDLYYNEETRCLETPWFGAFSSIEEYLKVEVKRNEEEVARFDCTPIQVASVPGNHVDLVIDGRYVRPTMEVRVNGWRVAVIESEM